MTPFDRLGRFVVRRAWWVVGAWVALLLVAIPFAPQVPGPAERRRVHPRRPRIGPREDAARVGARRPAVGAGHRVQQPDARGRHAGLRGRGGRRDPRHPGRAARRPGRVAQPVAAPGLGRPPHGVRRRVPRPATRRLARCAADPARAAPRRARARGRAGRRSGLLRRRPDRVRGRPPTQRAHLAAAGGTGAHRRLRFGRRRGRPAGRRWRRRDRGAGRHLRRRLVHADEHLRAQPRDAARARPRRRLLAAADEPLPRGARAQTGRPGPRAGCGQGDGRDGRPGDLLQRVDRAPRAPRPGPLRVHDPALGRDRRRHRRGARGRLGADPAAGDPHHPRTAGGPPGRAPRVADGRDGRRVVAARPPWSCATRSRC